MASQTQTDDKKREQPDAETQIEGDKKRGKTDKPDAEAQIEGDKKRVNESYSPPPDALPPPGYYDAYRTPWASSPSKNVGKERAKEMVQQERMKKMHEQEKKDDDERQQAMAAAGDDVDKRAEALEKIIVEQRQKREIEEDARADAKERRRFELEAAQLERDAAQAPSGVEARTGP